MEQLGSRPAKPLHASIEHGINVEEQYFSEQRA
jgi:hypothetical protein